MSNQSLSYSTFESRYRDKEYIGAGGFAKVYKVFDHAKNHYVALKVADVRPEWQKFTLQREVELVNSLPRHRNIARYDACYRFNTGFTGEVDFAVLKFYEYGNLEQFLTSRTLTAEDKKLIIQGILEGIHFLHRNNIIHRDLKAQNILMNREDGVWTPKITDFGLSREVGANPSMTNSAIGLTYDYAAPEQIKDQKIHKNVDLWAAGVIIYRVITGELPFKGKKSSSRSNAQAQLELSRKIVNLELPPQLHELAEPYRTMLLKCFVLDPAQRIQSAKALIKELNGEKYQSVPRQSFDKTAIVHPTSASEDPIPSDDATQLITPLEEEGTSGPATDDYDIPEANPTQVVPENKPQNKSTSLDPAPQPVPAQPASISGGDAKNTNWIWILLFVVVFIGAFGAYQFFGQKAAIAPIPSPEKEMGVKIIKPSHPDKKDTKKID